MQDHSDRFRPVDSDRQEEDADATEPEALETRVTATKDAYMPVAVQIRSVPEELHQTLEARAARTGRTLSEYLLAELRAIAERPSLPERLDRLHRRLLARVAGAGANPPAAGPPYR